MEKTNEEKYFELQDEGKTLESFSIFDKDSFLETLVNCEDAYYIEMLEIALTVAKNETHLDHHNLYCPGEGSEVWGFVYEEDMYKFLLENDVKDDS